jgi:glycosyltransferase involved in cell wall biosynthesis
MPQVSIGMPIYDKPEYLEEAIESLLGQSFRDFELLISDNASPNPRIRDMCERYAARDGRVRYVRQPANIGAHDNFMYVFRRASAPFFMWASDDDVWKPDFIARGMAALAAGPEKSAWFCHVDQLDSHGTVFKTFFPYDRLMSTVSGGKRRQVRRFLLESAKFEATNLVYALFRRDALAESVAVWDRNKDMHGADLVFVYAFICRHDVAIDPEVLFYKRFRWRKRKWDRQRPWRINPFNNRHFAGFSRAAADTPYAAMTRWLLPWNYLLNHVYKLGKSARRRVTELKSLFSSRRAAAKVP